MNEQPVPSTTTEVLTGSTGQGFQDGGIRAGIVGIVNGSLLLLALLVEPSPEIMGAVIAIASSAMVLLFGIFDSLRKKGQP